MTNIIDKKATVGGILQITLTPFFVIVFGTLFSLISGYKANDQIIFVKVIVWMINLLAGWIISTSLLKVAFKRKVSFLSYKYLFFAYIVSVILIWSIGIDESDYSYVTSAIQLLLWWVLYGE